jgi:hypothetical protein
MQYIQRKLHLSVTDIRRSRSGLSNRSFTAISRLFSGFQLCHWVLVIIIPSSKWQIIKTPAPTASSGALRDFGSLRVRICLYLPSGLRPVGPAVPAIHPTSKLVGILAKGIKKNYITHFFWFWQH